MVKLNVMYETVREVTIEVPDEVATELDFQAMWEKIHQVIDQSYLSANILVVAKVVEGVEEDEVIWE